MEVGGRNSWVEVGRRIKFEGRRAAVELVSEVIMVEGRGWPEGVELTGLLSTTGFSNDNILVNTILVNELLPSSTVALLLPNVRN